MKQITFPGSPCNAAIAIATAALFGLFVTFARAQTTVGRPVESVIEKSIDTPQGLRVTIEMIGLVTQTTDLQIICILKHDPAGDKYIEAMNDLNDRCGGLLSSLRDRGDFCGELGETLLFTPPPGSIRPARVLLIGVGDESTLTLNRMRLIGSTAAREAIRLRVANVSFAQALRDQGSVRMDVAGSAGAVAGSFLLAYDTEKRLESEDLTPKCELTEFTVEAGRPFFDTVVHGVTAAIASATAQIKQREPAPYHVRVQNK